MCAACICVYLNSVTVSLTYNNMNTMNTCRRIHELTQKTRIYLSQECKRFGYTHTNCPSFIPNPTKVMFRVCFTTFFQIRNLMISMSSIQIYKIVVLVYIFFPIQLKFQFSRSACSLFDMDHRCLAKRKFDYATLSLQRASIAVIKVMAMQMVTEHHIPPTK